METKLFGELHESLRKKQRLTLRKYCEASGFDPGNISKIERGRMAPPQNDEKLAKMATILGLSKNSKEWQLFFFTAHANAGKIPKEVLSDEEVLRKIPLLFRKLSGQKLTKEELTDLIETIRRA